MRWPWTKGTTPRGMTMDSTTEYQFWVRVLRMAAAIIGASMALWLLSGDRDPSAATLDFAGVYTLEHAAALDRGDIAFFGLRSTDGGLTLISADKDLALTQWLLDHEGTKVRVNLRVYNDSLLQKRGHADGK